MNHRVVGVRQFGSGIAKRLTRDLNVLSLQTRILLGFVFVEAALVVFVITTQFFDGPGNPSFNHYEAVAAEAQLSERIDKDLQKIIRATEQYIAIGDRSHLEQAKALTAVLKQSMTSAHASATSEKTESHLQELDVVLAQFSERFDRLSTLRGQYAKILDSDFHPTMGDLHSELASLNAKARSHRVDAAAIDALAQAQKAMLSTQLRVIAFMDEPGNKTASATMQSVRQLQSHIDEFTAIPGISLSVDPRAIARLGIEIDTVLSDLFTTAFTYRYVTRGFAKNEIVLAERIARDLLEHSAAALERLGRATRDEFAAAENAQLIYAIGAFIVSLIFAILVGGEISQSIRRLAQTMRQLACGNIDIDVSDLDHRHEIGDMAGSIEVFKENAQKIEQMTGALRSHAEEIEKTLEKEQELNQQQRQFVSLVSHEFRTPLAIIDGTAQRLIRRSDKIAPERRNEGLHKVRSSVNRLIGLMEALLSSERLESGKIKMRPSAFDLKALVDDVCDTMQTFSEKHRIDADTSALPENYFGDAELLHQVIVNLLSNAIKYSPDSDIIRVICSTEDDHAVITVRDYGLGIPEKEMPKLFERFFRASTSVGITGTGIGLHLINALVKMHNGEIAVRSVVDEGSTFIVTLPLENNAPAHKAA